nr:DUF2807 domain-containing protein [Desulfobulbaceae bacterium]
MMKKNASLQNQGGSLRLFFILGLFFGLLFLSPYPPEASTQCLEGNRIAAEVTRTLDSYQGVKIDGAFDVEIKQEESWNVKISGDENLLAHVVTTLEKNVLKVFVKESICSKIPLKLSIGAPSFHFLDIDGAGTLVSRMEQNALKVTANGSFDILLQGKLQSLVLEARGATSTNAQQLEAKNVSAKVHETATVLVSAENKLVIECFDASSVKYSGSPKTKNIRVNDVCDVMNSL